MTKTKLIEEISKLEKTMNKYDENINLEGFKQYIDNMGDKKFKKIIKIGNNYSKNNNYLKNNNKKSKSKKIRRKGLSLRRGGAGTDSLSMGAICGFLVLIIISLMMYNSDRSQYEEDDWGNDGQQYQSQEYSRSNQDWDNMPGHRQLSVSQLSNHYGPDQHQFQRQGPRGLHQHQFGRSSSPNSRGY